MHISKDALTYLRRLSMTYLWNVPKQQAIIKKQA